MSDRDALYAAILAHPDEDTPRLAFADWLEEHGDARYAAFIRANIELSNVPEWNPLWIRAWNDDRDALTGYRYKKHEPRLPDGLEWPALTSYRRGFLWHVESRGVEPFLKHADKLITKVPLQALTINAADDWPDPIDLTALFASPHLARLKYLGFSLAYFTPATVRQMQACPHLRNLTALVFEFAHFDPTAIRALFQPPLVRQLETLRFESTDLDWRTLSQSLHGAGGPHRLRQFVVAPYSSIWAVSARSFAAPLLRGLREFEISGCELSARDFRALCTSPVVTGLESLTLNKTAPGVPGIETLSECATLRGLKRLSLRMNRIGAVAMKHLARSQHLAGLQVLDLESNPLGDKGATALAQMPCVPNLVQLELMGCNVGNAGAEALLNALSAEKLIDLSLNSGDLIGAGVRRKLRKKFGARVFV